MTDNFFDPFDCIEDDEIFSETVPDDFDEEDNYPTAEEYNRIRKQNFDYF